MSKYPLTGFSKISWEEFCGMLEMLQLYKSLGNEQKEIIDLMMLGMQKREEQQAAQRGFASTASKLANVASPQHLSNEDSPQSVTSDSLRYPKRVAQQELDESYQKGDIVKIIADDEYYGILVKIYEKCVDSRRSDLYAVVPLSNLGEANLGLKIYAGCSLQLVSGERP
jgi:hypothetical protein